MASRFANQGLRRHGAASTARSPEGCAFRSLLALTFVAACAGCADLPPKEALPLGTEAPFSATDGVELADEWWHSFEDPLLAGHVDGALQGSYTLRAAYERLSAARAIARREAAALFPMIDAVADGGITDGDEIERRDEIGLGLEASWEVDLWGRIRDDVRASELEMSATAEDYEAAAITLAADVATLVFRLCEARAQIVLIESQLETNRKVLQVILARFGSGRSSSADVFRQRQLVEATNEQRIRELATADVLEHQLAALKGLAPQDQTATEVSTTLPSLPELPAVGLPAELVTRRPDIRASWLRLEAADVSVAAAVKDRYPRIDLSAAIATRTESASELFSTWIGSLAGQILGPLVDGGRRRREVDRTLAVRRERLADYGATVLAAFQEVEDALALERRQTNRIASLEKQLEFANTTYNQLRIQYLNGAADFLDILTTLQGQQALARNLLEARLDLLEFRISLHRAIAGGFVGVGAEATEESAQASTRRETGGGR